MKKRETKMAPITMDIDDVQVTLRSIERNKLYECKCESYQPTCELKQKFSTNPSPRHLVATEAFLNVRNASTEAFPIETSSWELIDTDGFAYKAQAICDALRPPKTIDLNSHERASPGTQVNVILLFPELERKTQIACLAYWRHPHLCLFEINKSKQNAKDLVQIREEVQFFARSRIDDCRGSLEELRQTVQVGMSKTLTRMEADSLEKKIKGLARIVEQTLRRINKTRDRRSLETEFQITMSEYQGRLEDAKKRDEERKKGNKTLDSLLRLHPREFEEYVEELLAMRGYEKTNQRGGSGDQGTDILVEKNGERVAVQCKLYKGKVGTPEVQSLLGAMQLHESQKGLLITTGGFSLPAEAMARNVLIDLVDGNTLIEWIAETRAKMKRDESKS